jgi:succinyl-diaminopimelate desuccinylase
MLRIYADPEFGAGYAYDAADITQARRNEMAAAQRGLDARIEHPFSGVGCRVREVLGELLDAVRDLADGLDLAEELEPLREMAAGGSNPAGKMRAWMRQRLGASVRTLLDGSVVVPAEVVCEWIDARRERLAREITDIARGELVNEDERRDLGSLLRQLEAMARERPGLPVGVGEASHALRITGVSDRVADVVELAAELVRIPSVTNCPAERRDEVHRCARFLAGTLADAGLQVRLFDDGPYASLVAGFPGADAARVCLSGHFDVVMPEPDDRQFEPRVEGDYLWGRGAADMKTVVASYVVWMRDTVRRGGPRPPINLMLVGNEENGEKLPWGTPHLLAELLPWRPELMVVGERTGEGGSEQLGAVCTANRGIVRLALRARGERGHTGTGAVPSDLIDRFIDARRALGALFDRRLTLSSHDGWESTVRFPFVAVGDPGVYNITAGEGVLGVEVRPIPEDDIPTLISEIRALARETGLECDVELGEAGIVCPADNPCLVSLLAAWATVAGREAEPGRKKPGSSARFAPGGNAVVWGQSGIGPHSSEERHFIPSVGPYLEVLDRFAERLGGEE